MSHCGHLTTRQWKSERAERMGVILSHVPQSENKMFYLSSRSDTAKGSIACLTNKKGLTHI